MTKYLYIKKGYFNLVTIIFLLILIETFYSYIFRYHTSFKLKILRILRFTDFSLLGNII